MKIPRMNKALTDQLGADHLAVVASDDASAGLAWEANIRDRPKCERKRDARQECEDQESDDQRANLGS